MKRLATLVALLVTAVWLTGASALDRPGPVHAAALTVTSLADSGADSLRDALASASSGDTITFGVSGTINLASPLSITTNVSVNATGQAVVLQGNNTFSILETFSSKVSLVNLTVTGGGGVAGGGLALSSSTVTALNSTISGNTVTGEGGGIFVAGGTLTLTNTTISGNTAGLVGGGIHNVGTVTLTNSTISGNTAGLRGGGINTINFDTATVQNSIVVGNSGPRGATDPAADCGFRPITSAGHNVFGQGTGCTATASDVSVAPAAVFTTVLGPLANNGGPTQTMALPAGSPAIDLVPAAGAGCPATDQRGSTRPQGPACDAGAFEYVPPSPAPTPANNYVPTTPILTVGTTGCGSVNPAGLPAIVGLGAQVSFTALPCTGSKFTEWKGGPCDGSTNPVCTFNVTTGTLPAMTATFSP